MSLDALLHNYRQLRHDFKHAETMILVMLDRVVEQQQSEILPSSGSFDLLRDNDTNLETTLFEDVENVSDLFATMGTGASNTTVLVEVETNDIAPESTMFAAVSVAPLLQNPSSSNRNEDDDLVEDVNDDENRTNSVHADTLVVLPAAYISILTANDGDQFIQDAACVTSLLLYNCFSMHKLHCYLIKGPRTSTYDSWIAKQIGPSTLFLLQNIRPPTRRLWLIAWISPTKLGTSFFFQEGGN